MRELPSGLLISLQMYGYPTRVRELSWDSTSRYLATGGSDIVTIWDCSGKGPAGTKPIELEGHAALISALGFAHRGLLIATASVDGRLVFWHIGDRERTRYRLYPTARVSAHKRMIKVALAIPDLYSKL